jgi:AraC-like DNA-binding protein
MLYYFALLSIIMSFLIAMYNWKVQKNALYIGGILVILSTYALSHYFSDPSQSDFSLALFYGTLSPLWLLPGPLLYFYFRSVIHPDKIWNSWKDLLHFIPSMIHLANITPYLLSPFSYKLFVAHAIHQDLNNIQVFNINAFYSFQFAFLSRPIHLIVYLVWCSILFFRQKNWESQKMRIWLISFIICLFLTTSAYLAVAFQLFQTSFQINLIDTNPVYLSSGIAYIFLPVALILFFPEVIYGLPQVQNEPKTEKLPLNPVEFASYEDLTRKIEYYLKTEKPYLNSSFELADVAIALGASQKQISFACKHILNQKFTDLRTHLRVTHAKELLQKGIAENLTVDAIGSNSGFKSRSTFYEAFKSETGMTPSQYLESL